MSWFDATGLASIAKSALKEAQRTIDKALDIREDVSSVPANTPIIDTNPDDFFGSWGITQSGNVKDIKKEKQDDVKSGKVTSSLWGSFTGSFFDASKQDTTSNVGDSLDDSSDTHEQFNTSKLVVQHSDDGESQAKISNIQEDAKNTEDFTQSSRITLRKNEKNVGATTNRLSVVSNESGKNSSESVEILTCGTESTTTPESEIVSCGSKPTSESIEILRDSLGTSPSSVEVIGSESLNDRLSSQATDDFISPLESPLNEEEVKISTDKESPDSVEIIPEDQDESNADTISYTSVSESTSATLLEFLRQKPQSVFKETHCKAENSEKPIFFTDAITRAPSRNSVNFPLSQTNQVLIESQPQSSMQEISLLLKNSNIIDIPQNEDVNISLENQLDSSNDGSHSDRTLIGDNAIESSSGTLIMENSQSVLTNMLAEAMTEKSESIELMEKSSQFEELDKNMCSSQSTTALSDSSIVQLDMPPREPSPISSESRSDLVKIGSDQTSGDELETTTSSDIEIISSPNGESSSTQSRQSPAKQAGFKNKSEDSQINNLLCKMTINKMKGHSRELSGASSVSEESVTCEIERLHNRISEISEILELRETKLVEVNRKNAELKELNEELRRQLDTLLTKQLEANDLTQVTEEYTQRLSALEKKFQQAIREKDILRKQLEQCKQDASSRMGKAELELLISEKDETIKELREEGEKLSKQQLQLSNIIKKLRSKEKENENTIKHLKESIEDLSLEAERLKRSLSAKEEVERTQIEAVHQLTNKNKKYEAELNKLKSQLDDLIEKYETTKKSLDAAKKELLDKNKTTSELQAREQRLESLVNEKRAMESQNEEILQQLEDMRLRVRQAEQDFVKKELSLRNENHELLRRVEEAESRNEQLSQSAIEVSQPLVRQLESLQATYNIKTAAFEKLEQEMFYKISELQGRVNTLSNTEKTAKEECITLRSKLSDVEGKLSSLNHQCEMLQMRLEQSKTEKQLHEQESKRIMDELKNQLSEKSEKVLELQNEILSLQKELSLERATSEIERKRRSSLQEQLNERTEGADRSLPRTGSNSPTLSLGKASVAESLSSSLWDEPFELSQTPRYTNVFEMQMLQSNLKQREGEVQQLQWELNRREQERSLLNNEISTLLTRTEELETKVKEYDSLKAQFEEVQQQYETLCQLYGEKVEENEELKLDLLDVKEMYKSQIDELLKQQRNQV